MVIINVKSVGRGIIYRLENVKILVNHHVYTVMSHQIQIVRAVLPVIMCQEVNVLKIHALKTVIYVALLVFEPNAHKVLDGHFISLYVLNLAHQKPLTIQKVIIYVKLVLQTAIRVTLVLFVLSVLRVLIIRCTILNVSHLSQTKLGKINKIKFELVTHAIKIAIM